MGACGVAVWVGTIGEDTLQVWRCEGVALVPLTGGSDGGSRSVCGTLASGQVPPVLASPPEQTDYPTYSAMINSLCREEVFCLSG